MIKILYAHIWAYATNIIVYKKPYRRACAWSSGYRVRARAKLSCLYTRYPIVARALGLAAECAREQRYLAYNYLAYTNIIDFGP